MKRNIFVTGFSGTGKTTVGREAARLLGWRFVDLTRISRRRPGKPIDAIFAADGEAHFRALESQALLAACAREGQVVSTGGGIVMSAANRKAMASNGAIVCLEARRKRYTRGCGRRAKARSRSCVQCLRQTTPCGAFAC